MKPTLASLALEAWEKYYDRVEPPKRKGLKYKSGRVYYIKLNFPTFSVYKIGYTTRSIAHRLKTMGLPWGVRPEVIQITNFACAIGAYNLEQALHLAYAKDRYKGARLIASGYTELYSNDILGLDQGLPRVVYTRL